jgi:hypothetical protein
VKTLEAANDTARNLRELVVMMNAFVAGEKAGAKPAALSKALNEINDQTKSVLNHFFLLAAGLILLLFVGLALSLLGYRYLARCPGGFPQGIWVKKSIYTFSGLLPVLAGK